MGESTLTIAQLCDRFLAQHEASLARMELLEAMLVHARRGLGQLTPEEVEPGDLAAWRAALPPATRWQATQALGQVLGWAVRWELTSADPVARISNPRPQRAEFVPFTSWEQIDAVSRELPGAARLLPWIGAGCGLRPGELLGLSWSDIGLERRELVVRRSAWRGELRSTLKTRHSKRIVPLREHVVERLIAVPAVERRGLVLASATGGPLDLHNLRSRGWKPALRRAGIEHPHRIYDLRHTYATWSLRAGVSIFQLARRMGTSVEMIDTTYGHLAADAADHELLLLDSWDNNR